VPMRDLVIDWKKWSVRSGYSRYGYVTDGCVAARIADDRLDRPGASFAPPGAASPTKVYAGAVGGVWGAVYLLNSARLR